MDQTYFDISWLCCLPYFELKELNYFSYLAEVGESCFPIHAFANLSFIAIF